jgi:trans-AT polyketide synthase/acyltransferase/oxidoreductase domain-containing protein
LRTRTTRTTALGWWSPNGTPPEEGDSVLERALSRVAEPLFIIDAEGTLAVGRGGTATFGLGPKDPPSLPLRAYVPAMLPENLGDPAFRAAHGVKYAYVAGEMANGIASVELVEAMGRAGMLGFFGSAGLSPERIEAAIDRLQASLGELPYGFNLIHSPSEPALEASVAELYLRRGVHRVCASAYLDLTLPVVRYRTAGIHRGPSGEVVTPNHLFAKVSRVEVARRFMAPPPEKYLRVLVEKGQLTEEQARLAATIALAEDVTAEADSGGHTDNRPAITLIPTMIALRDELQAQHGFARPPRIGAAGGIATPASAAAAFAMGAAYVLTGSINQACVEAATSPSVKEMLAQSSQADVIMAPAADMFEMGVRVQVLKYGTMFAVRARKLYDLYREHASLEAIPAPVRAQLERDFFKQTLEDAWASTREYFARRDPAQNEKAERDPKHKMALVFRAYLGLASRWAISGEPTRKVDYQVWCGPAMGAFNEWAKGSFLERAERRQAVVIAMNILTGCAVLGRVAALRAQGIPVPAAAQRFAPRELAEIETLLRRDS